MSDMKNGACSRLPISRPCMSVMTSSTVSMAPSATALRSSSRVTAVPSVGIQGPFIYSRRYGPQPAPDRDHSLRGARELLALARDAVGDGAGRLRRLGGG